MKTKILVLLILSLLLATSILSAQEDSTEILMSNQKFQNEIINYMVVHNALINRLMVKIMHNSETRQIVFNQMINNPNMSNMMMEYIFGKANSDSTFAKQMFNRMTQQKTCMDLIKQMIKEQEMMKKE